VSMRPEIVIWRLLLLWILHKWSLKYLWLFQTYSCLFCHIQGLISLCPHSNLWCNNRNNRRFLDKAIGNNKNSSKRDPLSLIRIFLSNLDLSTIVSIMINKRWLKNYKDSRK
jgi:hypothetical protein